MDLHIKVTKIWLEKHQFRFVYIEVCLKYSFQHHVHMAT